MRKILDTAHQRRIRLLEILLSKNEYVTMSALAKEVEASERTVAEDLTQLKLKYSEELHMEISRKNGVRLIHPNIASVSLIFRDTFQESVALMWLKELLLHPNQSMEYYEEKLFASKSTLLRMLPRINHFLDDYDMRFEVKGGLYRIFAKNEGFLRDFYASFLLELYGLNLKEYDLSIDLSVLSKITLANLKNAVPKEHLAWIAQDDLSLVYRMMFYLVSLIREEHGFSMKSEYPLELELDSEDFAALKQHFPRVTRENLRGIHEYLYLQQNGFHSEQEKQQVTTEVLRFIDRFTQRLNYPTSSEQKDRFLFVVLSIYFKVKQRTKDTSLLFDRVYYFSESLSRENPFLYTVVKEELSTLSQNLEFDFAENLHNILFWLLLAEPSLAGVSRRKTALLLSDFGTPHSIFLKNRLEHFFKSTNMDLSVDLHKDFSLPDESALKKYDIILSTLPDSALPHPCVQVIGDLCSMEDCYDIYEKLKDN
ncbi:helix-turn-helix domain-containing protein [Proteiniclasticum ruminis]|uniref:Transcriptional antiterminator n=1 Tax=Proteiniclasticum ruminis TaxID=398199 RepID=A0A1I5CKS8_9CLOT|nr:helix-turn-helix domain-containing protein [Proteiniclasticum ruminis]SFN87507.1 Transcriptional antiterminator [Proteiniclasticum ruminis]